MFVLDSSAVIDVIHGNERGARVMEIVGDEKFYITSISVHEIMLAEKDSEKAADFADKSYVFDFGKESAKISANIEKELKKSGKMINKGDIFIAAICIETNSTLVTCDGDFRKVAGLKHKIIN